MTHLSREELVDLADGTREESSAPHLASCDLCRQELAGLRAVLSRVAAIDVPEPSPLFWDQLSARVHEATSVERPGRRRWSEVWPDRRLALAWPAAGVAVAVLLAVVLSRPGRPTIAVPAASADPPVASDAAKVVTVPPDDPTLGIVADLSSELDWDDVHDAGIVIHTGLIDRAVDGLSAGERVELSRLLKQELGGGGV